jgi:hypothetical protein
MIGKLQVLLAAAATVVLFAGFVTSSSEAARADVVQLRIEASSIDGAVRVSTAGGWSARCVGAVCIARFTRGTVVSLLAEDGATSRFLRWEGACGLSGANRTCTIAADADVTYVKAQFSRPRLRLVTFGAGSIIVESATPGLPRPAWSSCGTDCREYEYGQAVKLRAVRTDSRFRRTGWGGACEGLPANHGCILTMRRNYFVSATFEKPPPARAKGDCPPNADCGPLSNPLKFTLAVS